MDYKILTIIIPTYNMENYLYKCLSSLLVKKGLEFLDVIVVNDGSKDSSLKIAHEFEHLYPSTFRVIDKENGNYGSCINRGLYEAKGKYIKILDADDYFKTNALEQFILFLQKTNADLILSDYITVNIKGKQLLRLDNHIKLSGEFPMSKITENNNLNMHAITYKTENLRAINYKQTEGISYTDVEWCFLPMITVKKVAYYKKVLYCYLKGREGQTMDKKVRMKSLWMLEKVLRQLIEWYNSPLYNKGAAAPYLRGKMNNITHTLYKEYFLLAEVSGIAKLQELDDYIKHKDIILYQAMNDYMFDKYIPIKYIKLWRKNPHRNFITLRTLYSLVKNLRNIWIGFKGKVLQKQQ